jgi:phosphate transport system substrate-binding protein
MDRSWRWCAALAMLLLFSPIGRAEQALRFSGSNTVGEKLTPALIHRWAAHNGWTVMGTASLALDETTIELLAGDERILVEVAAHGTNTGLRNLIDRRADIWMASRPASAAELSAARVLGALDEPDNQHVVALDGLAIIVHPDNDVTDISVDALRAAFAGEITDWRQLGGKAGPIALYARDDKSGTYDSFKSMVLGAAPLSSRAARFESSAELATAVSTDRRALGFVGLGAVGRGKTLAVGEPGIAALRPSVFGVATEDYTLSRRLYYYVADDASALIRSFIEFALGQSGQFVVEEEGFVAQTVRPLRMEVRGNLPREYLELTDNAARLSLNFRFGSGVSYLDGKSIRDLDRLARFLQDSRDCPCELMLFGFADKAERNEYFSISLSTERVDFIAAQMLGRGVAPHVVRGLGSAAPVSAESTDRGRARNRRVEVWVRPDAADIASRSARSVVASPSRGS